MFKLGALQQKLLTAMLLFVLCAAYTGQGGRMVFGEFQEESTEQSSACESESTGESSEDGGIRLDGSGSAKSPRTWGDEVVLPPVLAGFPDFWGTQGLLLCCQHFEWLYEPQVLSAALVSARVRHNLHFPPPYIFYCCFKGEPLVG